MRFNWRYVHDFAWLPDEKGVVVEPAARGGVGRLMFLSDDAKVVFKVVFNVATRGIMQIE